MNEMPEPMTHGSFFDQVRRFYEAERTALYTYAIGITGAPEAAEDAVHAAIERLLRRGRPPRELRPYVFRAVRNAAVDHLRRTRPEALEARVDGPVKLDDPAVRPTLLACLARLGPDERETVLLRVICGFTLGEIALLRRRSENTVASWYRRGLERLRRMLEDTP